METVRVVCGHDCPDMCSLLAHVEDGRVVRVEGDPDQPFTAGFACARVNRDAELVHSPDRLTSPLRRIGPKGEGLFAPITWDAALDEIAARWKAIIAEIRPARAVRLCLQRASGQMNRGLVNGLFHALGASRLQAGTVCDTCCEAAWDATVGPIGGADPETVEHSDLVISWGADLVTTNVHFFARSSSVAAGRAICRDRSAPQPHRHAVRWHLPIRIGTDAALALGVMHILVRDGLRDRAYLAEHTLGFDRLETRSLCRASIPRAPPPSPACRKPISSVSPQCMATPRPPSSAWARA